MKKIDYDLIRNRIRSKRTALGLSQEELGERVGLTQTQISLMEQNASSSTINKLDIIEALADALDVDIEYLLGIDPGKENSITINGISIPYFIWENMNCFFPVEGPHEIKTTYHEYYTDKKLGRVDLYVLNIFTDGYCSPAEMYDMYAYLTFQLNDKVSFICLSARLTDLSSIFDEDKANSVTELMRFDDLFQLHKWQLFLKNMPSKMKKDYNPKLQFNENAFMIINDIRTNAVDYDYHYATDILFRLLEKVYPNAPFIFHTGLSFDKETPLDKALASRANIHFNASDFITNEPNLRYHFRFKH